MLFSTALAAAGLVSQGVSMFSSFYQSDKNKRMAAEADAEAAKNYAAAMKKLQVNVYDKIGIAKEPYALARQLAVQQGAMGIRTAAEGESRGAGPAAGLVNMAVQNQEQQNRAAMAQDMYGLALKSAEQGQSNIEAQAFLDLKSAEGAQKASADAYKASQQSLQAGFQQLVGLGATAASMAPDVIKSADARKIGNLKGMYDKALEGNGLKQNLMVDGQPMSFEKSVLTNMGLDEMAQQSLPIWTDTVDPLDPNKKVRNLDPIKFQGWLETLPPEDLKALQKTGFAPSAGLELQPNAVGTTPINPFAFPGLESYGSESYIMNK